jgi:hypothetical protein
MPQWEYRRVDLATLPRRADEIDVLNEAGQDRWELVTITVNHIAYMRRPVETTPPAPAPRRRAVSAAAKDT